MNQHGFSLAKKLNSFQMWGWMPQLSIRIANPKGNRNAIFIGRSVFFFFWLLLCFSLAMQDCLMQFICIQYTYAIKIRFIRHYLNHFLHTFFLFFLSLTYLEKKLLCQVSKLLQTEITQQDTNISEIIKQTPLCYIIP